MGATGAPTAEAARPWYGESRLLAGQYTRLVAMAEAGREEDAAQNFGTQGRSSKRARSCWAFDGYGLTLLAASCWCEEC